MGNTKIRKT